MSAKLGTVLYGSEHSSDEVFLGRDFSSGKNYSEKTAAEIDDEIRAIISDCYERCRQYLTDNIEKLHFVAEFLLKNESMDDEQFKAAMEADAPTIEAIEAIATEKKLRSEEENKAAHIKNQKAAEEAEKKAAEEAKLRLEEMQKTGKFPVDDFFGNVFNVPSETNDGIESDDPEVDDVTIVSDSDKPSENAQNTESASDGENTDCLKNKSDSDENDN
jgi:cell division protease FtsH